MNPKLVERRKERRSEKKYIEQRLNRQPKKNNEI